MVQTRSQIAANAWRRFNEKQQARKARLGKASLATALGDLGLAACVRNRRPNTRAAKQQAAIALRNKPKELAYFGLTTQDAPKFPPKNQGLLDPVQDRPTRTKTVRILDPAEQQPPPIRTNVPWPLVGFENVNSAGSAPMDISAGGSVKTHGPWLKEQDQPNRKSSKDQEKMVLSPALQRPWNGYMGERNSRDRGVIRSPSLVFFPVWELAGPSSPTEG